jgi:hypothetical protein
MPPSGHAIQCIRCKHRFIHSDAAIHETAVQSAPHHAAEKSKSVAMKMRATPPRAAVPERRDAVHGLRWYHGAIAAVLGLLLVGGGIAGSRWLTQPLPVTAPHQTVAATVETKIAEKIEPKVVAAAKTDPDHEKRQEKFIAFMIAGGKAQGLKKWDDAIAAYGDAQKIFPDNSDLQKNLQAVKTAKIEALQAEADAEARKQEVAGLTKQAQQFLELKQPTEATKLLEIALSKIPGDPTATQLLAQAQTVLQAADPKKIGEKFDSHIRTGKAALKANLPADAIREFLAAKELLPDDPLPPDLIREAEKALVLAKNEKAIPKKTDYQTLMEKAKQLTKDKMYKAAAGAYQAALQLMPGDADATAGLAALQAQLAAGKDDAKTLQASGDQALRNKQVGDAINFYKQALQADPGNADLQRLLQNALVIQVNSAAYYTAVANGTQAMIDRRYGDAAVAFNAALSIAPGDPYVTSNLIQAQNALAQLAVMQNAYQNLTGQAQNALRVQQYSRALQLYQQAAASIRPPLVVDATTRQLARYAELMARATNAMNSNRFQEAASLFQAALQVVPGDNFANFGLRSAQQRMQAQPRPR